MQNRKKRLSQLSFHISGKGLNAISNKGGGGGGGRFCLWKYAPPLRQRFCLWRDRGRERGVRGSTGNWGVPSPPFFFSRVSHPTLSPCLSPSTSPPTLSTQRAQLCSPSPHQLAPVIPHFLLNATPSALSLLTSQQPLQGNGKGCTQNWGGGDLNSSTSLTLCKKKTS